MKLDCPECSQRLQLPDGKDGQQGRCPKCGAIFRISESATPDDFKHEYEEVNYTPSPPSFSESPSVSASPSESLHDSAMWQLQIADGRVFGPVDRETLDQWVREGRVGQDSKLKQSHDREWQPAQTFYPYLRTGNNGAAPPQTNPYGEQTYRTTAMPRTSLLESHRGGLILTLGLLGFCCFITGIMAWVMGSQDLNKMKAGTMDNSGEGLTRAGFVIGIITTVIGVLSMLGQMGGIAIDL